MSKQKTLYQKTLQQLVSRGMGLVLLVLAPVAIVFEFLNRTTNGRMDLGEFVEDIIEMYDDVIHLIAYGRAK